MGSADHPADSGLSSYYIGYHIGDSARFPSNLMPIGNSVGFALPTEAAARLKVEKGDVIPSLLTATAVLPTTRV